MRKSHLISVVILALCMTTASAKRMDDTDHLVESTIPADSFVITVKNNNTGMVRVKLCDNVNTGGHCFEYELMTENGYAAYTTSRQFVTDVSYVEGALLSPLYKTKTETFGTTVYSGGGYIHIEHKVLQRLDERELNGTIVEDPIFAEYKLKVSDETDETIMTNKAPTRK
jgi:hypothetical protein